MPAADARFSGALPLPDWGLIHARGADAAGFLQGQLSNDVAHLAPTQARLAAYCSPKGRMLASFLCWREDAQDLVMTCSADLLPATLQRLSMFVMRAKCRLTTADSGEVVWGLAGAVAEAWLGPHLPHAAYGTARVGAATVLRLPDASGLTRCLWIGTESQAPVALERMSAAAWRWLEVQAGVVRIVGATTDAFVPQMVNFEVVGGVDFKKGCYPGQEVVARSQYRGTIKRRTLLFECAVPMHEGQEVFSTAEPDQPAGLVALAASLGPTEHAGLVEIKLAALQDAVDPTGPSRCLHLGSAQGPALRPCALPYSWPIDQA